MYALHRYTAISALSPAGPAVHVRRAESSDLPALTALLRAQAAAEFELSSHSSAAASAASDASHVSQLSASAAASSALRLELQRVRRGVESASSTCHVVSCAGECVGLVRTQRVRSEQQLRALHAHYGAPDLLNTPEPQQKQRHADDSGGAAAVRGGPHFIRSFVLHRLFSCHARLVLQETMRLCEARSLLYAVGSSAAGGHTGGVSLPVGASFNAALLRCMQQQAPLLVPAPPIAQGSKLDARHSAGATSGSSSHSSAVATAVALADEADSSTARSGRRPHDEDASAPPGPPLSVAQLHLSHSAATRYEQQPPPPLLSNRVPSDAASSCPACCNYACPTFALHTASPPLLSAPRVFVSRRFVFVGASDTNLSALVSLLTAPSSVYFTSLTLISPRPLATLRARDSLLASAAVTAAPSSDFHLDAALLQRACLDARVQLVDGRVTDIDAARQLVTVHSDGCSSGSLLLVPYDELIVASGNQPSAQHIASVVAASGQQPTAHSSHAARVEASSGAVRQSTPEALTPASSAQSHSQQQQRPPSSSGAPSQLSSELPLADASAVRGVWPLSSVEHAVAFLSASAFQLLPSALSTSPASPALVVVCGASLSALSAICTLLAVGVPGECITWVHSHSNLSHASSTPSDPSGSLSAAVFGDELPLTAAVLNTLAEERIRIVQRSAVTSVHTTAAAPSADSLAGQHGGDSDGLFSSAPPASCTARRSLQSVALSSGDVLACSALLLCASAEVDARLLDVCVRRLGLVHDGRFVVDQHFRSATLPNVRLAGPMAKFQRSLLHTATTAAQAAGGSGSQSVALGVQLLEHSFYSSGSVGRALAAEIDHSASQQLVQPIDHSTDKPDSSPSAVFTAMLAAPCVRRAVLPGPLAYYHAWSPAYSLHPSTAHERVLTQSFASYTFSLHVCTATLRIVRVVYWGAFELAAAHNLTRLIGLPVTYCNRLLWRWESSQIRSLLLFFQQDWAQPLYTSAFEQCHQQLLVRLGGLFAGQLNPILDKLQEFQQAMQLDQHRRHEQQQYQQQRRVSTIQSALHRSTPSSIIQTADSADVAALQAVSAFLPAEFKDVTHRAVLAYLASQSHSLPASLQEPMYV